MSGAGGAAMASWEEAVVVVGVRRWDGRPSTMARLAEGLADHTPVLLVLAAPLVDRPERDERLALLGPQLARVVAPVSTRSPGRATATVDGALVRHAVHRALGELGSPAVRAVVAPPLTVRPAPDAGGLRVLVVGDDVLDGSVPGRRGGHLEPAFRRDLAEADRVVAGSPVVADALGALDVDSIVIADGIDDDAFALARSRGRPDGAARTVAAGFVGDLAGDVDLAALEAVARTGIDVRLVGRGPRGALPDALARIVRRSNVEWIGPRPPDAVPGALLGCRVGILPLIDSAYTRARLPLDALVHLAGGRPVVATDCEPARWLRRVGRSGVRRPSAPGVLDDADVVIAADPDAFAAHAARLARTPIGVADAARRRRFAADHRWSRRAAELASLLDVRAPVAVEAIR